MSAKGCILKRCGVCTWRVCHQQVYTVQFITNSESICSLGLKSHNSFLVYLMSKKHSFVKSYNSYKKYNTKEENKRNPTKVTKTKVKYFKFSLGTIQREKIPHTGETEYVNISRQQLPIPKKYLQKKKMSPVTDLQTVSKLPQT